MVFVKVFVIASENNDLGRNWGQLQNSHDCGGDSKKAAKSRQLLFDWGVIDEMNSVHEIGGNVFEDDWQSQPAFNF
jgi:hypothetical protein